MDHHWLALDDLSLLLQLGGWAGDRENKREGLTRAGLLMFGKERSILDAIPRYQLDYQEQTAEDPEIRWSDRVTIDGTWTPNLYNFYYRIYPRLVADLKVPFQLKNELLDRSPETIRTHYINSLLKQGSIELKYPEQLNHPEQAYKSKKT